MAMDADDYPTDLIKRLLDLLIATSSPEPRCEISEPKPARSGKVRS
jgi:hypothetical protein